MQIANIELTKSLNMNKILSKADHFRVMTETDKRSIWFINQHSLYKLCKYLLCSLFYISFTISQRLHSNFFNKQFRK